ncbi:phosphate ABC transporter permease subunit PstC [Leifsonia sp. ALI-44-B]|jgi:phosphate transport system permease protein|uniref:phosphate ABC transporter permease subunit PstC n=1 Tax=Leifsonia sp. ALI-44-B TaxID=1933776 RepID=UPI0009F9AF38|nr:phosphate ABC transporter permease subunit PstC [Leifsonia sp. ALI-44-B]
MSIDVPPRPATTQPDYPVTGSEDATPQPLAHESELSDKLFRGTTRLGGAIVLSIMVLVGAFLTINAVQAISAVGIGEFLTETKWTPETNQFGIAALITGTVMIAIVSLIIALPLSLGLALFTTEVARGAGQRTLRSVIDLMAAVPSVVFGLWGLAFLQPTIVPFARWLSTWFGWIPIFAVDGADPANPLPNDSLYTSSTFIAGLVVSLMIVPIMASLMIESFSRAPIGEREGAYALGATRWGMIRSVVLPFGKGGIIGGTMLGMGRALGETIAIYLIISPLFEINFHILERGANSIAAHIALRYGEANPFAMSALMAAGLTLFLLTMAINFTASTIIARSRSGAESEA